MRSSRAEWITVEQHCLHWEQKGLRLGSMLSESRTNQFAVFHMQRWEAHSQSLCWWRRSLLSYPYAFFGLMRMESSEQNPKLTVLQSNDAVGTRSWTRLLSFNHLTRGKESSHAFLATRDVRAGQRFICFRSPNATADACSFAGAWHLDRRCSRSSGSAKALVERSGLRGLAP